MNKKLFAASVASAALVIAIIGSARAEDADALEKLQPVLRADPSPEGLVTWWLVSPPAMHEAAPAMPPLNAREGARTKDAAGWTLEIADNIYNNFQPYLKDGVKGTLFASARVNSAGGGARVLFVKTYCAIKAWHNGQLVLDKPKPERMSEFDAALNFPKGISEITIELTPRGDQCMMQCLLFDAKNAGPQPRAGAGDALIYPMAGAGDPVARSALAQHHFSRGIALVPKDAFVKPGAMTSIAVIAAGTSATGIEDISVRIAGGKDAKPFPANGKCNFDIQLPPETRGVYEAKVEFLSKGKAFADKSISLLCLDGFLKQVDQLESDVLARAAKGNREFPNSRLTIEKLRLFAQAELNGGDPRAPSPVEDMKELSENARKYIELEEQGKDPFEGKSGYMERAYISRIDGGVQPYILNVPESAMRANAAELPLVVFLHGYDPTIDKHRWWEAKDFAAVCGRHDCFMAIPFGRSNTDFQSCGEVDVLDVIADIRKTYRIDPARIYLYGYSMGGMGVYTVAAHYPDLFAGGIVLAGRADNPLQNYSAMENFHPFKQFLMHADNPISLCENLINFPLRIYHGIDDPIVPKTQAMRMNARFKTLKADAKLILKPGGHTFGFEVLEEDEPLEWLLSKRRANTPVNRHIKSYSLAYAKQDGAEVSAISGALEPIDISWSEANGKRAFQNESANIVKKSIDGVPPPATDFRAQKTPGLCGPVRQTICAPFTIVYGTKGSLEANAFNKANAEHFAEWWFAFTRSRTKAKADSEITDEEKKTRNLFLFGEEQDNALHTDAAKSLPISVKNGSVRIGEKSVPLAGKGIMYLYPSPFAASDKPRAVVICAGIQYGEKIGANHKLDLIPDFLLYGADIDADGTSTNKPLCAGFFDGQWKLAPKTTWWME